MNEHCIFNKKDELINVFQSNGRWIRIKANNHQSIICISDLHGDCRTLNYVLDNYFFKIKESILIACGDYLDRMPESWISNSTAALDTLLYLKLQYPNRVYLLMGNHDLCPHKHIPFAPANAWDMMSDTTLSFYTEVLESLPIVATVNGVAFVHGTLPMTTDVDHLPIDEIYKCVWSDYVEQDSFETTSIRKKVGIKSFKQSLDKFGCQLLIKGHNYAPLKMFNNQCITIQTTRQFSDICGSHMALIDLTKNECSAKDVEVINLDSMLQTPIRKQCPPDKREALLLKAVNIYYSAN